MRARIVTIIQVAVLALGTYFLFVALVLRPKLALVYRSMDIDVPWYSPIAPSGFVGFLCLGLLYGGYVGWTAYQRNTGVVSDKVIRLGFLLVGLPLAWFVVNLVLSSFLEPSAIREARRALLP